MKTLLSASLVVLVVLTACSSRAPVEEPLPPDEPFATPTPEPTPEPTPALTQLPPEPTVVPVEVVAISADGGEITVRVIPREERALQFHRLDADRWGFYGDQEALVGKAYQIELENRTSSRAKIVVGVDGLNIFRKKVLAGNPADDIGSILSPGAKRTIPGWQTSSERAERFVFAPSDWSDAAGIRDAQIGTILVEVYFEQGSPAAGNAGKMKSKSGTTLGTTSGEGVDNQVGTVSFVAASSQPWATALLIYGGTSEVTSPKAKRGADLRLSAVDGGLRVDGVERGSTADQAGLKVGDVIVRADAVASPSLSDFASLRAAKRAGDTIFLEVRRGGQSLRVKLAS